MLRNVFVCAALTFGFGAAAQACSTQTPCPLESGVYFVDHPTGDASGGDAIELRPAVIYIHGWGGTGEGVFRNTGMVTQFLESGYVFAAPTGVPRANGGGASWGFMPGRAAPRDEVAFLQDVRDDLIANHNVDPERIVLAGFSIGGSMTAYLACAAPDAFSAYAPLGGNFWRPHPTGCEGPVRMLHTHGWTDGTVPLEGRVLRGTDANDPGALMQGDIFHALGIWRETNGCNQLKADRFVTTGFFLRRTWDRCAPGSALEFALFPGGHVIPPEWPGLVVEWFEGLDG